MAHFPRYYRLSCGGRGDRTEWMAATPRCCLRTAMACNLRHFSNGRCSCHPCGNGALDVWRDATTVAGHHAESRNAPVDRCIVMQQRDEQHKGQQQPDGGSPAPGAAHAWAPPEERHTLQAPMPQAALYTSHLPTGMHPRPLAFILFFVQAARGKNGPHALCGRACGRPACCSRREENRRALGPGRSRGSGSCSGRRRRQR